MQSKEISSILQISINTDKFFEFTLVLNAMLKAHDKRIQQHTRQLAQIRQTIEDQFQRIRKEVHKDQQKFQIKHKEENCSLNTFMKKCTLEHQNLVDQWNIRIHNLENDFALIKEEIITDSKKDQKQFDLTQHKEVTEDIKKQFLNEINAMNTKVLEVEQKMRQSIESNQCLLRKIFEVYQNRKNTVQNKQSEVHTVSNNRKIFKQYTEFQHRNKNSQQIINKQIKQKVVYRYQQNLQYASVSAKLDSLQARLNEKQNPVLNKIIWATKRSQAKNSQPFKPNITPKTGKSEGQNISIENSITAKLEHIEQILQEKFCKIDRAISRITADSSVLMDKIDMTVLKVQKDRSKLAQVCLQLKKLQDKKLDDNLMGKISAMIKCNSKNYQDQIENKVTQQHFNKQKKIIDEKLRILHESLAEKADKDEIKKAFDFVEDKIKDIIMILSADIQQQKQGALARIPFKCLSCDKDLDFAQTHTQRINKIEGERKLQPRGSTSSTSQIRKRIRVLNTEIK